MYRPVARLWAGFFLVTALVFLVVIFFADSVWARNILEYRDTLSTSAPGIGSNHTLSFRLEAQVDPGGYIEVTPPEGFEILATTTFDVRNVELRVNGSLRQATSTVVPGYDMVEIFPGTPGSIRYTVGSGNTISPGSLLELKIGNHTTGALDFFEEFSTSTLSTTTIYADVPPIINASTTGTHEVDVRVVNGVEVASAGFLIALVERVGVGPADTRETVPPFRFNPAPTSTVGGTTLSVELSLETDELAICRYSRTAGVDYNAMTLTFSNTGLIYHSTVVSITPNSVQQFYIRCIDDEGNFNTDDFLIIFTVNDVPSGSANTEGDVSGDGTGTGNQGTGDGSGSGGTTGDSDGEAPELGGSEGTGGSGGGGGGGRGENRGSTAGGGFESTDDIYPSGDGRVEITGYASPRSRIVALVDGREATQVTSGNDGSFSIAIEEIARGVYTFGIYALDPAQTRSTTFSTSFTVTGARTSALSNINLTPSVKVDPDPVNPGQTLTISGYTLPNAAVTVENERDKSPASRRTFTATADGSGRWSVTVDTASFSNGTYKARARAVGAGGVSTSFSNYTFYGVGQAAQRPINADLNRDGRVNLVDFSILLFWWNTDGGTSDPPADINADGRVTLTDFSIMLFNWTG